VVNDVNSDDRLSEDDRRAYGAQHIGAFVAMAAHRSGDPVAALVIHSRTPRDWSPDLPIIEDVFVRIWESAERARAGATLAVERERFRLIIEGARDYAILSLDAAGRIVSWSAGATAIFGWTAEEAIGQPADITFTQEDRANSVPAKELDEARRTGVAPDVRWHMRKDGTRVFIEGSTSAVLTDASGELAFLKIGQDVTRRLEMEEAVHALNRQLEQRVEDRTRELSTTGEALRESDARYRTLFESMRAVDYRFVEVNPAFGRLTGIQPKPGQTIRELAPDHETQWFEIFGRVALTGDPVRIERPARSFNGWFDLYAFRIGDPVDRRIAVLFSDILERKQAEAERDTLRARLLQAEEEERKRLARELHDEAGQHLTALGLGLRAPRTVRCRAAGL
jgi:PAS domain S-box-containing protein